MRGMTVSRDEAIRAQFLNGALVQDIALEFGVSEQRVYQIIGHELINRRRAIRHQQWADKLDEAVAKRAAREAVVEEAIALVLRGISISRAAKIKDIASRTLRRRLKERGVESCWGRWRDRSELKVRVETLIQQGAKVEVIPELIGSVGDHVSPNWIYENCSDAIQARRSSNDNGSRRAA